MTADGRITASRITPGMSVLVKLDRDMAPYVPGGRVPYALAYLATVKAVEWVFVAGQRQRRARLTTDLGVIMAAGAQTFELTTRGQLTSRSMAAARVVLRTDERLTQITRDAGTSLAFCSHSVDCPVHPTCDGGCPPVGQSAAGGHPDLAPMSEETRVAAAHAAADFVRSAFPQYAQLAAIGINDVHDAGALW